MRDEGFFNWTSDEVLNDIPRECLREMEETGSCTIPHLVPEAYRFIPLWALYDEDAFYAYTEAYDRGFKPAPKLLPVDDTWPFTSANEITGEYV